MFLPDKSNCIIKNQIFTHTNINATALYFIFASNFIVFSE